MKTPILISDSARAEIAEILERRANDIASFHSAVKRHMPQTVAEYEFPGSVDLALTREITRLRALADMVKPPKSEAEEQE